MIVSVVSMLLIIAYYSDEDNIEYDYDGIVHSISQSKNGFTFTFDTDDRSFRCYHSESPVDLGHYRIKGTFSDDGNIFFIEFIKLMDKRSNG